MTRFRDATGLVGSALIAGVAYGLPLWLAIAAQLTPSPEAAVLWDAAPEGYTVGLPDGFVETLLAEAVNPAAEEPTLAVAEAPTQAERPEADRAEAAPTVDEPVAAGEPVEVPREAPPSPEAGEEEAAPSKAPEAAQVAQAVPPTEVQTLVEKKIAAVTKRPVRHRPSHAKPKPTPEEAAETARAGADNPLLAKLNPALAQAVADQAAQQAAARAQAGRCGPDMAMVRKVDDTSWEVDRTIVEHYTSSLQTFNTLGWSKPYRTDEGDKGWQIMGFGCRSPLFKGGLRSRDVLKTVNGKKTNNVVQLFFLYQKLKHLDTFEVVVLRKGEELTLTYTLE